ncbi:NAD(P)H-hydrate dehydratase [Variovorax sp. ZT4R33]|uniref:NAD(P)H-hydrate dehydratase n=1 Tax=Variovorax sp. ZT4R33 TaxID=3443743 RepID=UPI003F46D514
MQRITANAAAPLFDIAATRRIELAAAAALPPHTLMQRAGRAVARLAMALTPDARTVWIACGPGNNGGDGFEAAAELRRHGFEVVVSALREVGHLPPDARASLVRARAAGVVFAKAPPACFDLAIDALLGIGARRAPEGTMADWLARMHAGPAPVLSIDVPSGLDADTGTRSFMPSLGAPRFCLTLLTRKPGLFTGHGRDAAGELWFDDLGCAPGNETASAGLNPRPAPPIRAHASHKGSFGDVAVVGGAAGMAGAALLAASAALHAGAGRVYVAPLDAAAAMLDVQQPELMFRALPALDMATLTVVCGCGGGAAVQAVLPRVLSTAGALVLDADALNGLARDASLKSLTSQRSTRAWRTVLTPHPLEAARLLESTTALVQADRLGAARRLADAFGCTVVLKGSGTVIAAPGETPRINATGNARLATAGTGDVLAGMVSAALAAGLSAFDAACEAVWRHGDLADRWPVAQPLTAGALASGRTPLA